MADEINYAVGNAAVLKIQGLWRRAIVRERTYVELKAVWEKIFDPVQQCSQPMFLRRLPKLQNHAEYPQLCQRNIALIKSLGVSIHLPESLP